MQQNEMYSQFTEWESGYLTEEKRLQNVKYYT